MDDAALCARLRTLSDEYAKEGGEFGTDALLIDSAADRIEALARENAALREALRGEVIHGMTKDPRIYGITHHLCQLCKSDWLADGPEEHAADCLAAIREQAKGG